MLACESSSITSSFALRVNMESAHEFFFTGRQFMSEVMISIRWSKSVENKLALFKRVSKLLKTFIELSTKLLNCSFPCLGRITHEGQGLLMETDLKVACASVIISSGCEYFTNRICNAEIRGLLLRS